MTTYDLIEGTLENSDIQQTLEAPAERTIIRRITRILSVSPPNPLLCRRKRESKIELVAPGFSVIDLPAYLRKFDDCGHLRYLADGLRRQPVFVPRHRRYGLLRGLRLILRAAGQLLEDRRNRSEL